MSASPEGPSPAASTQGMPAAPSLAPDDAAARAAHDVAETLLGGRGPLAPLTPEAGTRRYWRPPARLALREGTRWLVVTAPDPPPYATAALLEARGVRTPRLGARSDGGYLVEDLGDRHLRDAPSTPAYRALLADLRRFAAEPLPEGHPAGEHALDAALFRRELRLFRQHWLQGRRGRATDAAGRDAADALLEPLSKEAAAGPWTPQHRDFHCRNLLLPDDGAPAWIDHQDLRPGPLYYDLASLWTDAYVEIPDGVWPLLAAERRALAALHGLDGQEASERFSATALQRVLKALGTFAMLLARGRSDYAAAERRARAAALALVDDAPQWAQLRPLIR